MEKKSKLIFKGITMSLSLCNKFLNPYVSLVEECCLVNIYSDYTHKIHKREKEEKDNWDERNFFFSKFHN